MEQSLFTKLIFKIAHCWTIHIDIEEYIEFLNKLYDRIIVKKIIRGTKVGEADTLLPEIHCEIT